MTREHHFEPSGGETLRRDPLRAIPDIGQMRGMLKGFASLVVALLLSLGTVWIQPPTDETAMYGSEGRLDQIWLTREVAGWPAPFLADAPGISVPHKIGAEDTFRLGPFVGTLSFWFIVTLAMGVIIRRYRRN